MLPFGKISLDISQFHLNIVSCKQGGLETAGHYAFRKVSGVPLREEKPPCQEFEVHG